MEPEKQPLLLTIIGTCLFFYVEDVEFIVWRLPLGSGSMRFRCIVCSTFHVMCQASQFRIVDEPLERPCLFPETRLRRTHIPSSETRRSHTVGGYLYRYHHPSKTFMEISRQRSRESVVQSTSDRVSWSFAKFLHLGLLIPWVESTLLHSE
jgi:hypothetical protein